MRTDSNFYDTTPSLLYILALTPGGVMSWRLSTSCPLRVIMHDDACCEIKYGRAHRDNILVRALRERHDTTSRGEKR